MNKKLFIVLNIIYFGFHFFGISLMPNPLLFNWLPLQEFLYWVSVPVASLIWGIYYTRFFRGQKDL